jgi:hypothetical protein
LANSPFGVPKFGALPSGLSFFCDGVADGECPTPTPSHFIRPCAQKAEKGW